MRYHLYNSSYKSNPSKYIFLTCLQGDEVDGEEEDDNETDNDDFWEELDSAKRASAKKAAENPGRKLYNCCTL